MSKKMIAVLLSSYNGEKYIEQQIESIMEQNVTYELHLFIRDDGSVDNTVSLIENMRNVYGNITLFEGNNIGSVASFFSLMKMAYNLPEEFCYFALADQDDVWDKDKLLEGVVAIDKQEREIPILYGSATRPANEKLELLPKKNRKRKPITLYNTIIQNFIPGHTYVMNRKLLEKVYDADPSRIYVHDSYILNVAIINGKLIFDNNPHVTYRQHANNQLGTSHKGIIGWVNNRLRRLSKGDGKQYARQIEYIYEQFQAEMRPEERKEIKRFIDFRCSFIRRLLYILRCKIYRQRYFETIAFKFLYFLKGYNV